VPAIFLCEIEDILRTEAYWTAFDVVASVAGISSTITLIRNIRKGEKIARVVIAAGLGEGASSAAALTNIALTACNCNSPTCERGRYILRLIELGGFVSSGPQLASDLYGILKRNLDEMRPLVRPGNADDLAALNAVEDIIDGFPKFLESKGYNNILTQLRKEGNKDIYKEWWANIIYYKENDRVMKSINDALAKYPDLQSKMAGVDASAFHLYYRTKQNLIFCAP
jgi:hypothetical protein